jgi:hypothetical protein
VTPLDIFSLASGVVAVVRHYLPPLDLRERIEHSAYEEMERTMTELEHVLGGQPGGVLRSTTIDSYRVVITPKDFT